MNAKLVSLLQTREHGIECREIVVEEAEKKHGNVEGGRCWKCSGERMLLVVGALLIAKNGRGIIQKKLGSCRGDMPKTIQSIKNAYNTREVKREVCNWLRHLGTKKAFGSSTWK